MAKTNKGNATKAVPTQFDPADEVEKIGKQLIPKYHSHLIQCRIAWLFKNKAITSKGVEVAATAEKISKKHHALSGYHFLITTAYPTWKELSDKQKLAVVDHELEHCFVEDDEKTGEPKYSILPHDVEEFGSIIKRHGLYTTNLVRIGHVVEDALENLEKKTIVKKIGNPKESVEEEEEEEEKPKKKSTKKATKKTKKKAKPVEEEEEEEEEEESDVFDEDEDDDEFIGDEA